MHVHVHGAGRDGRDAWPGLSDEDAVYVGFDLSLPMRETVAQLGAAVPADSVVFAHSAGAVPVALCAQAGSIAPRSLVLVEPGLYDLARGDAAIERHIEAIERARALSSSGDLFGYWSVVRPLMFGGTAELSNWSQERETAARFEAKQPPWGFSVDASAIGAIPTLVVTGDWNAEYEVIAGVLSRQGAIHRHLRGHDHRPQDHEDFSSVVEEFLRSS